MFRGYVPIFRLTKFRRIDDFFLKLRGQLGRNRWNPFVTRCAGVVQMPSVNLITLDARRIPSTPERMHRLLESNDYVVAGRTR